MMLMPLVLLAAAPTNCAAPQTQSEMTECADREYRTADLVMNQQWCVTLKVVQEQDRELDRTYDKRPGYAAQLLASQRAWLQFRDSHCAIEGYAMRGGSAEPMLVSSCLAELTRMRTRQLRSVAELSR